MTRPALSCAVNVWEEFESDPVNLYPWGAGQELDTTRARAAQALGCAEAEIALTPSTTVALNMVNGQLLIYFP